jgi:saccharopine dehydrogenase-like NADP-dependent oxidoreductase
MSDCETFIRGTIRYKGFSAILAALNDVGLTSDDLVPSWVRTLRELAESKLRDAVESRVHPCFE